MEMSAPAKSKKIRDYAALVLPALMRRTTWETGWMDDAVSTAWALAERMYEKEVETYDRIMKEAEVSLTRRSSPESSVTGARRGSTRDV